MDTTNQMQMNTKHQGDVSDMRIKAVVHHNSTTLQFKVKVMQHKINQIRQQLQMDINSTDSSVQLEQYSVYDLQVHTYNKHKAYEDYRPNQYMQSQGNLKRIRNQRGDMYKAHIYVNT